MLRIKADRMNELEKFGFEKEGKTQWTFRPREGGTRVMRIYGTGRITFSTSHYTDDVMCILYQLIKADMVEEVTE